MAVVWDTTPGSAVVSMFIGVLQSFFCCLIPSKQFAPETLASGSWLIGSHAPDEF